MRQVGSRQKRLYGRRIGGQVGTAIKGNLPNLPNARLIPLPDCEIDSGAGPKRNRLRGGEGLRRGPKVHDVGTEECFADLVGPKMRPPDL